MIGTPGMAVCPDPSFCNKAMDVCVAEVHLVDLMPAVLILAADGRVFVQQQLAALRVSVHHDSVIQSRQTTAVFIVR